MTGRSHIPNVCLCVLEADLWKECGDGGPQQSEQEIRRKNCKKDFFFVVKNTFNVTEEDDQAAREGGDHRPRQVDEFSFGSGVCASVCV